MPLIAIDDTPDADAAYVAATPRYYCFMPIYLR